MTAALPAHVEVVPTVDGTFMVLVNGFQWGPDPARYDASGANDATWPTEDAAAAAYREAQS